VAAKKKKKVPFIKRQGLGSDVATVAAVNIDDMGLNALLDNSEYVVPVIQEQLQVGKRRVITGQVKIHKTIEEHLETLDIPLLRETVEVKRVPIGEVVSQPASTRQEGDTLIIPVFEEVLVIEKRFHLIEEIHVTTKQTQRREVQKVLLRREKVLLERDGKEV
jgi:uncharacterized protein (TIGR02271 family)